MLTTHHSRPTGRLGSRTQRGVGLIEVLIAVLVLAFGMLGLAGLQIWSLKNNESSMQRGMAVVQTYSVVDAMRADRTTALNNGFDIAINATAPTGTSFAATALGTWRASLVTALGASATGSIDCNGALCVVTVQWNDERATGGSATQSITTEVQL